MLKKIYEELVAIRKELQAIRSSLEPRFEINSRSFTEAVQKAIRDTDAKYRG